MAGIRFIHTADLHLDSPFGKLSRYDATLADRLRDASFKAFRSIVDTAIRERVDFVIIAGDIFDSENSSLRAQLDFFKELKRLSAEEIPVYFNCGNHDPLSSWMKHLSLPEGAHRFSSREVETILFEKEGEVLAEISGISFEEKSVHENLALHFPEVNNQVPFHVAVLHGTVGAAEGHTPYAPFSVEDVIDKGYDYWALGHIHKPEIIRPAWPAIAYPGIPQGRDFGESGARGYYFVSLERGEEPQIEFLDSAVFLFQEEEIALSPADTDPDIIAERLRERIPDDVAGVFLRVVLTGQTPLHTEISADPDGLRDHLNEILQDAGLTILIDRLIVRTQAEIDLEQIRHKDDFPAALLKEFDALEENPAKRDDILKELESGFYKDSILRKLEEWNEDEKKEIMERAQSLLLEKILKEDE